MVLGPTILTRYGKIYNLNQWDKLQLRGCLERLLNKAFKLVNEALPVVDNITETFGRKTVLCTLKRADCDSHEEDWLTYLAIPKLDQVHPWEDGALTHPDDTAEPAPAPTSTIVPGINTADISTE
jgi:hypothetical protein